jgi:hypothetical protein
MARYDPPPPAPAVLRTPRPPLAIAATWLADALGSIIRKGSSRALELSARHCSKPVPKLWGTTAFWQASCTTTPCAKPAMSGNCARACISVSPQR